MKNTNFDEKLREAIEEIIKLQNDSVETFGEKLEECFPAMSGKLITIGKKEYCMKIEITLNPVRKRG